jgi:hypothetical protein
MKTVWVPHTKDVYQVNCGRLVYSGRRTPARAVPFAVGEIDFLVVNILPEDGWDCTS